MATGEIAQSGTGKDLLNDPAVHETYLGGVAA
jgi:ABC-type branched-subunit amino acid transport system ATPase component